MAKKQVCVRTYPNTYIDSTNNLDEHLKQGYIVVMCNPFRTKNGMTGNEYILEKEVPDNV